MDSSTPTLAELRDVAWRLSPDSFAEKLSDGDWQAAPHHRVLARKVRETIARPNGRLIISMPPRHGKSELTSHWALVWLMALNPKARILFASYEATFAEEWGRAVRNTIEEHSDTLGVRIAGDSSAAAKWRTTDGGGMWTSGPGGSMTGRGADLLVIDDPHKNYAEAHSPTIRKSIQNWYMSTARTRLQKGASVIIIMTRWHEDDLAGWLLSRAEEGGEQWDVLSMPAIAERDEVWELGNGETWQRSEGEPLWTDQFDKAALDGIRLSLSMYLWVGLYLQRPAPPEGNIVHRDWWKYWDTLPARIDQKLISVDTTFKNSDGTDYVVMQAWAKVAAEYYLLDQVRARMNYVEFKAAFVAFTRKHRIAKKLIEETANGPAIISELQKTVGGLIGKSPKDSKLARAHAITGVIEAGNVFLPSPESDAEADWVSAYVEEWAEFRGDNKGHDDQVDATTQALLEWIVGGGRKSGVRTRTAAGRQGANPTASDLIGITH